jgi:hypothetical protein
LLLLPSFAGVAVALLLIHHRMLLPLLSLGEERRGEERRGEERRGKGEG